MKTTRRVLITGASIAGPTLAYWLSRQGMDVTVVERAPGFRDGGQTIDICGAGRVVAERMGIVDAIRANSPHEESIKLVGQSGTNLNLSTPGSGRLAKLAFETAVKGLLRVKPK
ncbi:hypothetical protein [Erwinia tasmaniensis]|uniref:hypothetical protein n=1 Tax=Erwinia tasmaniensis TaxID=338565 RepID=UPI003A4E5921